MPRWSHSSWAGDPDYDTSLAVAKALPKAGADIIELGMPFTDPMADGPAIQAAGLRALKAGQRMTGTLSLVRDFRKDDDETPIILMGYYNPIYIYGNERFLADAKAAGVDGLIIVDLPPEEDEELCLPALKAGLNFIRLADPHDRRQTAAKGAHQYVGLRLLRLGDGRNRDRCARHKQGDRGGRADQTPHPASCRGRLRSENRPASRAIAEGADGVVVGSALVDALFKSLDKTGKAGTGTVNAVTQLVSVLAQGVRSARRIAAQ